MKKFLLVLSTIFLAGFTTNKDGTILLSINEVDATKTYISGLEDNQDELIKVIKELQKELKAEKSKVCI